MKNIVTTLLEHQFVRFCIVGASGFVINAALLTVLNKDLHSPFVAQLLSSEIALFSNFLFHHNWTYRKNRIHKTLLALVIQFHLSSWVAIIGSAVLVTVGIEYLHLQPLTALGIASVLALFWNFVWTRYVIWRSERGEAAEVTAE